MLLGGHRSKAPTPVNDMIGAVRCLLRSHDLGFAWGSVSVDCLRMACKNLTKTGARLLRSLYEVEFVVFRCGDWGDKIAWEGVFSPSIYLRESRVTNNLFESIEYPVQLLFRQVQ